MSLNVPLLRRVQASIADRSKPFDMNFWCDCVAGHLSEVCGLGRLTGIQGRLAYKGSKLDEAVQQAGLTMTECDMLFYDFSPFSQRDRERAIARIERVIESRAAEEAAEGTCSALELGRLWEGTCSALEPAAQSRRARAESEQNSGEEEILELVAV